MAEMASTDTDDVPITEQYARRVIAAAVDPDNGRFTPEVADKVADEYITELEVAPTRLYNGDVIISATLRGIDKIQHAKKLDLFDFQVGQLGELTKKDDAVHMVFSGFKPESGSSVGVSLDDNGLLTSDDGIKCVFSLTFE